MPNYLIIIKTNNDGTVNVYDARTAHTYYNIMLRNVKYM